MIRFIHAADLHIDRPFEGISGLAGLFQKQLLTVNQKILTKLIDAALKEQVEFVLLAGDTFHQSRPSLQVQHYFFQEISRLEAVGIPVYMIFGNHDYYDPQRYWFDFPANVHLFTEESVKTIQHTAKSGETYAISGFSYQQPWINESKAQQFPTRGQVDYHIGLYHGDMTGERYAPFNLTELRAKGYDYWALGHIHQLKILAESPYIVYAGTPQGKTRKEQAAGIAFVTMAPQQVTLEFQDISEVEWTEQTISLAEARNPKEALQVMKEALQADHSRIVKVSLTDDGHLPEGWLTAQEIQEMLFYLNDALAQTVPAQAVSAIELPVAHGTRISLPASQQFGKQLWQTYQDTTTFNEVVTDMLSHPIMRQVLNQEGFQEEVLEAARKQILRNFQWETSE